MTRVILLSLPLLLLVSQSAWAASASGYAAMALAGVVAPHMPTLSNARKLVIAKLFDGHSPPFPSGHTISITADSITCRAGNVQINYFNCELKFGTHTVTLNGRKANEIYATLIEAGVPGSGAAGTIYESLTGLSCIIDPNKVEAKDGSGADCNFTANP
jgi:hypothetical protein